MKTLNYIHVSESELAVSTQRAIEIISPWFQKDHSYEAPVLKDVQRHLPTCYARAINSSVGAAITGHTVFEEALVLIDNIQTASTEDREGLSYGIIMTSQGLKRATLALDQFKELRTTVRELIENMKVEGHKTGKTFSAAPSVQGMSGEVRKPSPSGKVKSELLRCIHELENIEGNIGIFVKWWLERVWEAETQLSQSKRLDHDKAKLSGMGIKVLQRGWTNSRDRYYRYVNEIQALQDQTRNVFEVQDTGAEEADEWVKFLDKKLTVVPQVQGDEFDIAPQHREEHTRAESNENSGEKVLNRNLLTSRDISVSLKAVQLLEKNLCFLILEFQCLMESAGRNISSIAIEWRFTSAHDSKSPLVIDLAPRRINDGSKENHHGRTITVTKSGYKSKSAKWTIKNTKYAMPRVPLRFCVAVVISHVGPFAMELEVLAKQRPVSILGWLQSSPHIVGNEETHIDVESPQFQSDIYKPSAIWRDWFPLINGEVNGYKDRNSPHTSKKPSLQPRGSKMLVDYSTPSSYMSAHLGMVQILPNGLCFLRLDIQCIPLSQQAPSRIDRLNIVWSFTRSVEDPSSPGPIVINVAPKQSIGARSEEARERKYGVEVPAQVNLMGATMGPQFTADYRVDRKVDRAMIITGFIRGNETAEWRVLENSSAMSGIPTHLCVGAVVQYSTVIAFKLELHATQRTETMGISRRGQPLDTSTTTTFDVNSLQHDYEPENTADKWKEWFPKINGDVEGYNLSHSQAPLSSS